jgi:Fe-S oxidoreductase/nitrate reductase gamma subunit
MPTRQLYWNISFHWLLYPLLAGALGVFTYGFYQRWRLWMQGGRSAHRQRFWAGVGDVATYGFGHRRTAGKLYPGVMHLFIFWGSLLLFFATVVVALEADLGAPVFKGDLYLFVKASANGFGLLVLVGLAMAAWRRYVVRPASLDNRADDGIALGLLAVILLTGFAIEGARMAAVADPWGRWGFVGYWLSGWFAAAFGPSGLLVFHRILWWFHLALVLGLIAYLPYSKLLHVLLAPTNLFVRPGGPMGVLATIDFEDDNTESYGVGRLSDLPRKTLFGTDVCLRCGRCRDACPATASGKHLDPKAALQELRVLMEASGQSAPGRALIGDVISEADIWSCTTCRACEAACPVFVGHADKTLEMRRHLVLMEGRFPSQARLVFRNMEVNGNPLGESALIRGDLLRKLGVPTIWENSHAEILYWPGCAGSLETRNQKVTTALVKLMNAAGVSLATLGNEEKCCGEAARRLGNEYLYQTLARGNIEVLNGYEVKRIVTQCPHCFNTLKHEYPQLGGEFEVLHHTEFLSELVDSGRLKLAQGGDGGQTGAAGQARTGRQRVTYHDSCYLGRYNGIFDSPRSLLRDSGYELIELPRTRSKAFCCGAGGGRMWLEEDEGDRINLIRTDEVLGVGPDIAAVACPYCLTMLKDGVDDREAAGRVRVLDLAEVLQLGLQ